MKPQVALKVLESLRALFKSLGKEIRPQKPVPRPRPEDVITVSYEFLSPMGQSFIVSFKTLLDEVSIVIDPPVGDEEFQALKDEQAGFLVAKIQVLLEMEGRVTKPIANSAYKKEKVLA